MVSASAFRIMLPLAMFSPVLRAAVTPCEVSGMQRHPDASASSAVLSEELLFTNITSTRWLVLEAEIEDSVFSIVFSSLNAGIIIETSGEEECKRFKPFLISCTIPNITSLDMLCFEIYSGMATGRIAVQVLDLNQGSGPSYLNLQD